jgi:hypothetical protein
VRHPIITSSLIPGLTVKDNRRQYFGVTFFCIDNVIPHSMVIPSPSNKIRSQAQIDQINLHTGYITRHYWKRKCLLDWKPFSVLTRTSSQGLKLSTMKCYSMTSNIGKSYFHTSGLQTFTNCGLSCSFLCVVDFTNSIFWFFIFSGYLLMECFCTGRYSKD